MRVWRCLPARVKETALESGPSFTKDRRYSIQGEFGAVYFSASKALSQLEVDQRAGTDVEPMAHLGFELTVDKLVDLTSPKVRKALHVSLDALVQSRTAPDRYRIPQLIAR